MTGFIAGNYGSYKKEYVPGLIHASLCWYITGEKGYVLRVNGTEFKKHFMDIEEAERVADRYIMKKLDESKFINQNYVKSWG